MNLAFSPHLQSLVSIANPPLALAHKQPIPDAQAPAAEQSDERWQQHQRSVTSDRSEEAEAGDCEKQGFHGFTPLQVRLSDAINIRHESY